MKPQFWKLSQGTAQFEYQEIIESIANGLVYIHKNTKAKGGSGTPQVDDFINAPIGDYFYLTHGNEGMFLIGQFSGPANIFSKDRDGWLERPFKFIIGSITNDCYKGEHKWWTPIDNSTFMPVPNNELRMFEKEILKPFFGIKLSAFGIKST